MKEQKKGEEEFVSISWQWRK